MEGKATLLKSHFGMTVLLYTSCIFSEHLFLRIPLESCGIVESIKISVSIVCGWWNVAKIILIWLLFIQNQFVSNKVYFDISHFFSMISKCFYLIKINLYSIKYFFTFGKHFDWKYFDAKNLFPFEVPEFTLILYTILILKELNAKVPII